MSSLSSSGVRAASRVLLDVWDEDKVVEMARRLRTDCGGGASMAFVFCSQNWRPHVAELVEIIQVEGHAKQVVGCSAQGIVGTGQEDDEVTGCSVLFVNAEELRARSWVIDESFSLPPKPDGGVWVLLGNPMRLNVGSLLEDMNRHYAGMPVYGGMAGGGWEPDSIFLMRHEYGDEAGAGVLVHLDGVPLRGLVSQGCQPIGEPYTITRVKDDVLMGVGGRRAYDVLVETFEGLSAADKTRAAGNIMAGLAATEYREEYGRGDFLIRNIIAGDSDSGGLRLGSVPRVGQTMQFQLREKDTADEDLRLRCAEAVEDGVQPGAALLFTCGGRGQHLFGVPNHDAGLIAEHFGPVPVAGFFANGEFGPVCGINSIHGYTASVLLIG